MKNDRIELGSGGKLLAMDTATAAMSVALLENGMLRRQIVTSAERNHSLYLLPSVKEAMEEEGWKTRELSGIAVGRGPGSYTGVRIGVTAAKTMAWALGVPVVGVSSLEAMAGGAWRVWSREAGSTVTGEGRVWVIPLLNARRGQAFTAWFEGESGGPKGTNVFAAGWSRQQEDGIRLMEPYLQELLETIRSGEQTPEAVIFTGEPGYFTELIDGFAAEVKPDGVEVQALPYDIEAECIGYLGELRLAEGAYEESHALLPNYTQLPEAEVKLLAKKQH